MDESVIYKKAPRGWSYSDPNPFTSDGSYGSDWSSFCILDTDDDQGMTGKVGTGSFSARFGRRFKHLEAHLIDFIHYENRHRRTVILSFPEDMDIDQFIKRAQLRIPMMSSSDSDSCRPPIPIHVVH